MAASPSAALAGAMPPIGWHKGIGIAMRVQALLASLRGAAHPSVDPGRLALSLHWVRYGATIDKWHFVRPRQNKERARVRAYRTA